MSSRNATVCPESNRGIYFSLILLLSLTGYSPSYGGTQIDTVTCSIPVKAGWNLLSLPADVPGGTIESLFPTAVSHAFVFDSQYNVVHTSWYGQGFWLKFASAETISVKGFPPFFTTIYLHAGWNLIGALTTPLVANAIQTSPPGIVASNYFGFNPDSGYKSVDTLWPGSGYWVKVREAGMMFMTIMNVACPGIPTVDYGGKTYNTVKIGSQCWMAENMDVGTMDTVETSQGDNDTLEKYCYNDDPLNCTVYGGLYQWGEAMQYSLTPGAQGICPPGWHIPTDVDFQMLTFSVGEDGNALKAIGQGTGAGAGTNASGFSALLAGWSTTLWFMGGGIFDGLGGIAYFLSSTVYEGLPFRLVLDSSSIYINLEVGSAASTVRCLQNEGAPPNAPSTPSPAEGDTVDSLTVQLSWTCDDPDGAVLTYDVFLGMENPPTTNIATNLTTPSLRHGALNDSTVYFWKIVASDGQGNSTQGPVWSFTGGGPFGLPCPGTPTIDYGGKIYNTVLIGDQCWMKENLDIGTMIPGVQNASNNGIVEKYCYGDNPAYCDTFGGLYQWDEAMQYTATPGTQGICPAGWHIPTYAEYETLSSAVGGDGNALKAVGQGYPPYEEGTNLSGFSALLAGYRDYYDGSFYYLGYGASFWSSTENDAAYAYYLRLSYYHSYIYVDGNYKTNGFSVRCLED